MPLLLGIDFETTGLDPVEDRITEIGMVIFDVDTLSPVRVAGFLVKTDHEISDRITELTGLTRKMLDDFGVSENAALSSMNSWIQKVDWVVGHNAKEFDRLFLQEWYKRAKLDEPNRPWADTKTDLPKKAYGKSSSQKYMACDHGFLYDGHRAVNDVMAMFKILAMYDIKEFLRKAAVPNVVVQAVVSYEDRGKASERGYHWQANAKLWTKPIKEDEVETESENAPFPIKVVGKEGESPR